MIQSRKTSYLAAHLFNGLQVGFPRRQSLVSLLFWLILWPATTPQADKSQQPTLLVIGDSISAAYGLDTKEGWVTLLQKKLAAENYPLTVVNASVTGDTTSNGLARLPDLLTEYQPALVIIELGGNDGLRGLSIKKLTGNLISMASQAKDIGADVIITAVQLPENYGKAYNRLFKQAFSQAAESSGAALVPSLFDGMGASAEWFQSDGIHPAAKAQPLMLNNVWRLAEPFLTTIVSE